MKTSSKIIWVIAGPGPTLCGENVRYGAEVRAETKPVDWIDRSTKKTDGVSC
jgi:hypothetical protein